MANKIKYLALLLLPIIFSCRHKSILQNISQSSNFLHCYIMFGKDEISIKNENKTVLDIGIIDTTDEHSPIPSAIIKIANEEIILNRIKYDRTGNEINEEYSGKGYLLFLKYIKRIDENGEPVYKGALSVENKNIKEEFDVVGYNCNI